MSDNYEHKKPYSLTASYLDIVEPSALTAPYDLHAVYDPDLFADYVRATLSTGFISEISGLNLQPVDNSGYVDAYFNCGFVSLSVGFQDINHQLGVELGLSTVFKRAVARIGSAQIPSAKAILRVSNEALFFDQGLVMSVGQEIGFDRALTLSESIHSAFDQSLKLSRNKSIDWQENFKIRITRDLYFDESIKLRLNREFTHQEMIRKRRNISFSHQVTHVIEKWFSFDWDKGLELVTQDEIPWDNAKSIHYRKHPIEPWPEPEIPQYQGTGDLNFVCLCHEVDSHNVELNFGADDCIPAIPNKNWWHILNTLSVTRLDNSDEIDVLDGNYSTDRSRWCWSYSLTVPARELPKLEPINGQPVILKIIVNGNEHQMLLENRSRSRKFAQDVYVLTGRSPTALLSEPYSPVRSFLQENERTSVQLCQAELDRVFSATQLNWQLIDELGWIVANNSLSYSNLAPIAVIKMIAESGGGFVYSEKNSNALIIKPLYKKTFWDSLTIDDYDRLIPESIVTAQSTDYELYPDYNGITLTNDRSGKTAQVKRTGSNADTLLPAENNPLFDHVSMGSFGKSKLAKAGMVETHTFTMPISSEIGECMPGEVLAFNAEWWGIVDSVSVSFGHAVVNQTIKVEHVKHE
ncbi:MULTISPECIES: hypothetical protein [Acinetobacter]|uniref:Phage late control D family protein n=1 Tax=Acinetobacter chengduensis TaxID=2420890 RepID=A0ABX9TR24_9GAMM|nr:MULTISPECIES: hypothetical protein [Acinetobacter]MBI1453697.1 hypothetical protein [Acinetobacter sp. FL51]RLL16982.1 hypothetical protein D9K81_17670 [Acinetobacter chengduensis]